MRKKSIYLFLIVISGIFFMILQANAESKKLGEVKFKSSINENYKGEIELNYVDKKGYNILFNLSKANDYEYSIKVPAGKYKLDSIDVEKGYIANVVSEFEIVEGKTTTLDILVKPRKTIENTEKEKVKKVTPDKKENKSTKGSFKIGNTGILTLVIFLILGALFIYFKVKDSFKKYF